MIVTYRSRHVAFTLIEVVLAVALSALLFVLIGAGMNAYSRLVSDRRANVVNAQAARSILNQIASDLRSAYYSEDAAQDVAETEETGEEGGETGTGS